MSTLKTPFRYDFVGSFLRPEKLKAAKKAFEEGTITKEELDRITDECVTEIVAKQKAAGFHAITDGEFRRKFWHLDFMWGFEGVAHEKDGGGVQFNGEMADLEATYLVGKVKAKVHPFVEYFKFLKQFEDEQTVAKYTIPAPAQMYQQMIVPQNIEQTRKFYATDEELIEDSSASLCSFLSGGRNASKTNLLVESPDSVSAVTHAHAPGRLVTSMPASYAIFTSSSPGSEIPGVPASVISAIFVPASSFCTSSRPLSYLLYSW